MTFDIKICGLSRPGSVEAALAAGASHVGFIFFEPSPRNVAVDLAAALAKPARGRACRVAVTVDAADDLLDAIAARMQPDLWQLHGRETAGRIDGIRQRYGVPVMKALPVREAADLAAVAAYRGVADRLLLDAKPLPGSVLPGGNGMAFDWSLLDRLDDRVDYMLSGGIDIDNVASAVTSTRASGIDVSSGVEKRPGEKDDALIGRFVRHVRSLERTREFETGRQIQ